MIQGSQGRSFLWCICLLTPAGWAVTAPGEPQGTPVPLAHAQSSRPAAGEPGSCSAVASQLPAPSSLPVAPGWGWGCGGVSQSRMPIWNPLGTFNPPHPFWCCLSSPLPTHTNAAIQAVNLNKFCPAATSRSDEKAKRSCSKPRGEWGKKKKRKKENEKKTTQHGRADTQKDQLHPPIPASPSPPLSQAIRYHAGCVIGWQRIERDILKLGSNLISTRLRGCCEIVGCRNEQHAEPVGRRTSELEQDDDTGRWKCLWSDSES